MAIPGNMLSALVMSDFYIPPDNLENTPLMDFEWGGIALNDPSEGLRYQTWTLRYFPESGAFSLSAPNSPPVTIITVPNVTQVSLAFDGNMQPFFAYVEDGDAKFYWWDTNVAQFVHTALPAGSLTPRCCTDDKRTMQTGAADIILCYVHAGALKMRMQRDRYTIEYTLDDPFLHPKYDLPAVLIRVGMNAKNRLQWLCDLANPIDWCGYKSEG